MPQQLQLLLLLLLGRAEEALPEGVGVGRRKGGGAVAACRGKAGPASRRGLVSAQPCDAPSRTWAGTGRPVVPQESLQYHLPIDELVGPGLSVDRIGS